MHTGVQDDMQVMPGQQAQQQPPPQGGDVAAIAAASSVATARPGWVLAWHDEFDGTAVDVSKWELITKRDNHNLEKQYYVPEQAAVSDSVLRITAVDKPLDIRAYRSARLESWVTQSYGLFECRARMPRTQGMWPAVWLLPRPANWPFDGEIDVMEYKGRDVHWTSAAYHFADDAGQHKYVTKGLRPLDAAGRPIDLSADFHVYALEWTRDELRFSFDGRVYYRVTPADAPIPTAPMSVVLNLAVGGWFDGDPDDTTVFPQHLDIDYVRVWRRPEPGERTPAGGTASDRDKSVNEKVVPSRDGTHV